MGPTMWIDIQKVHIARMLDSSVEDWSPRMSLILKGTQIAAF